MAYEGRLRHSRFDKATAWRDAYSESKRALGSGPSCLVDGIGPVERCNSTHNRPSSHCIWRCLIFDFQQSLTAPTVPL